MRGTLPSSEGLGIRQLRYVLALSERRSIRRAARALSIPAGVLSREIATIERAVGIPLFERHPRGAIPTAAGTQLAVIARQMVSRHAAANRDVAGGEAALEVGYLDYGPGQDILRAALAEFQSQYPHVTVQLAPKSFLRQQAPAVAEGVLGVGFSFGAPAASPGLRSEALLLETVGSAMLPADHRLAARDAVSLRELSATPIHTVRRETAPDIVGAVLDGLTRGGWQGRLTPGSSLPSEVMTMIACGAGWAPTPSSLQGWIPLGTAIVPLADGAILDFELHVVWREADALAAAFVRLAIEIRDVIEAAGHSRLAPPPPDAVGGDGYRALLAQRHAERARIARDLHDTVLQGVLGTQLQLEALRQRLPPELAQEREVVRLAVERLGRVGREARETVRRMRPTEPSPRDLALALASAAEELREESPIDFRLRTEGTSRALCTGVEEAAYRIGVEALTNAFRHASAGVVSVSFEYWDDEFRMCVADDGAGIPPEVLSVGGRNGHFGLATMRERAAEVAASLTIRSDAHAGTRVELVVPGSTAFVVPGR